METSSSTDFFTDQLEDKATILLPGEGERLRAGDGSCTFKVTSELSRGRLGIYEIVLPPHTVGARPHYHRFMDEVFLVQKGVLTLELSGGHHLLSPGATVYVPRFTPHGFANTSGSELVLTLIFNPSEQREGYFRGLFGLLQAEQMDVPLFLQLARKHDTHPVDLPRFQPLP
ncbi:MAG TPA: cupin domain-containing protein [Chitinophagaceae bacterium]|jgi:quercetin dioxygenase-like cupin family protein|nr:cupin domain-containing protein [Chitinophagaceae bacterium]